MSWWVGKVRKAAPPEGADGIPIMPESRFAVDGFEEVHPGNYIEAELAKMNWNHKDSKVQRQGAYGWSKQEDLPVQRVTAASIADELRKADKEASPELRRAKVDKNVSVIVHPHLRQILKKTNTGNTPGASTAEALNNWLRKAIKCNPYGFTPVAHPADFSRGKMLLDFVNGKSEGIPSIIGIQVFCPSLKSNIDLNRVDPKSGRLVHRYVADPANVAYIVAYRRDNGKVKRDRPLGV